MAAFDFSAARAAAIWPKDNGVRSIQSLLMQTTLTLSVWSERSFST